MSSYTICTDYAQKVCAHGYCKMCYNKTIERDARNQKERRKMTIYKTRYQALKNKTGDQMIVKVSGGYTIMEPYEYRMWKHQK